jgi:transcriptional regulator with XRE-family HTH domain
MRDELEISAADIKNFRKANNLSQQELASILNVGITTVSRWENNAAKPSGTAEAILASLLNSSPIGKLCEFGTGAAVAGGLLGSGYALYTLLRRRFEDDDCSQ